MTVHLTEWCPNPKRWQHPRRMAAAHGSVRIVVPGLADPRLADPPTAAATTVTDHACPWPAWRSDMQQQADRCDTDRRRARSRAWCRAALPAPTRRGGTRGAAERMRTLAPAHLRHPPSARHQIRLWTWLYASQRRFERRDPLSHQRHTLLTVCCSKRGVECRRPVRFVLAEAEPL